MLVRGWSFRNRLLLAFGWILVWDLVGQPAATWYWRGFPQWATYLAACVPPVLVVFGSTIVHRIRGGASAR